MAYTKQTWTNNDSSTPLNAPRLGHIEDGIGDAHDEIAALAPVAATGSYTDLTETPVLAAVATTGAYSDISGKPAFSTVATTGQYSDLIGKPTLSTVANTGSYNDLLNQPTPATLGAVPTTRLVAGHALSADVTLAKTDVGLGNVDNTADAAKAVLSATKLTTARTINGVSFDGTAAITVADSTKVPTTRTVAGQALSADVTAASLKTGLALVKADVGLGSVDNTADAAKNVLSATKLTTARTINGNSFDGTANITIDANEITTGVLPVAQIAAGATLTVVSTTSWPARPTSRTDVFVRWLDAGGLGTEPAGALDNDSLLAAS